MTSSSTMARRVDDEVVEPDVRGIAVEQPLHEPGPRLVGVLLVRFGDVFGDALDGRALRDASLDGAVELARGTLRDTSRGPPLHPARG